MALTARRGTRVGTALVAVLLLLILDAGATDAATPDGSAFGRSHAKVCGAVPRGLARCHADVVTNAATGAPLATSGPSGYGPSDLRSAYGLGSMSASGGSGQTVAIVDAYDDPNAEADLAVYRSQFGLPACTTANSCFRKVNQNGGTTYPSTSASWAQEISLDLDMVSA